MGTEGNGGMTQYLPFGMASLAADNSIRSIRRTTIIMSQSPLKRSGRSDLKNGFRLFLVCWETFMYLSQNYNPLDRIL